MCVTLGYVHIKLWHSNLLDDLHARPDTAIIQTLFDELWTIISANMYSDQVRKQCTFMGGTLSIKGDTEKIFLKHKQHIIQTLQNFKYNIIMHNVLSMRDIGA